MSTFGGGEEPLNTFYFGFTGNSAVNQVVYTVPAGRYAELYLQDASGAAAAGSIFISIPSATGVALLINDIGGAQDNQSDYRGGKILAGENQRLIVNNVSAASVHFFIKEFRDI
jgi:hypothetical protein